MFRRGLSSTVSATKSSPKSVEQKVSKLPNGLTVASIDNGAPISQLVLAFRAGSRYEQSDEAGLVHHLRNSVGTDSEKYLGVKLLWQTGNIGANLNAIATKDIFAVQLSAPREGAPIGVSLLGELGQPAFKPWEVVDMVGTVKTDLANVEAYDTLIELLHKASFRNGGLGNALLSKSYNVGKVGYKTLGAYAKSRLLSGEAAIFGINVDHNLLVQYATEQINIAEGKGKAATPSPYKGGEVRQSGSGHLAHVAVVGEGAKLSDPKSVAVQAVLATLIANAPNTKYSSNNGFGIVASAVNKESSNGAVGVSAINIAHFDSGVVGFYLVADESQIGSLTKKAVATFKSLATAIDGETLEIAKQQAATEVHLRSEDDASLALDQAVQLLSTGSAVSPVSFAEQIKSVTAEDVKKAAAKLSSKLSIASFGAIENVPYLDEL
uniref:Peptidase_M16 domain-containing protein n=1 Tax=Rhabditophanes sp. KR3021 TaxID=114890 RepID=A0AC35UGL8_9BILA